MKILLTKKSATISLITLLALGIMSVAAYAHYHSNNTQGNSQTSNPTTPAATGTSAKGSGTAPGSGNDTSSTPSTTPTSSTTPASKSSVATASSSSSTNASILPAPTGQLLNVTTVSIKNGPGLESICSTTPGASCDIRLTSPDGLMVKYLGSKTVSDLGSTDPFEWQPNILTAGSWTIAAVATFNGQTTISDSYSLKVTP